MLKQEHLKDVSSQTLDISLEDEVDALRINTFLPRGVNRRAKDTSNEKESQSTEDVNDKSLNRKQATSKICISKPKILKQIVGPTEEECYTMGRYSKGICIIISNEDFHPSLQLNTRKGSEKDLKSATELFTGTYNILFRHFSPRDFIIKKLVIVYLVLHQSIFRFGL